VTGRTSPPGARMLQSTAARWLPLAAPVLVALALGLLEIGRRSITLDESASIFVAETPTDRFLELLSRSKLDMSLYFVILRPWLTLGSGEGVVRALSVVTAAAAIPFAYLTVARLIDRRTAVVASLLLAVNAFFIQWAQQARGYGLAMLLAAAATYFLVRTLDGAGERRWWIAYGITAGLGVYAHVLAGLVVGGHGVALLLGWRDRQSLRRAGAGLALAAVVAAPMLAAVATGRGSALEWIGPLSWEGIRVMVRNLTGSGPGQTLYLVGLALAAVVLATWLRAGDRRARGLMLLLCCALVPAALTIAVSTVKPILVPRYLLPSLPFVAAVVAAGYLGLVRGRVRVAVIGLAIVVVGAWSLPAYYESPVRADYRRLTLALAERGLPGDAVTWWQGFHSRPSVYYARRFDLVDRMPVPLGVSVSWHGNPYVPHPSTTPPAGCLPARLWLVGGPRRLPEEPTVGWPETIRTLLANYGEATFTRRYGGTLRLRLFELTQGPACPIDG
jgi:mannosyltransferase